MSSLNSFKKEPPFILKKRIVFSLLLIAALVLLFFHFSSKTVSPPRAASPRDWAVRIEKAGLPNLHRISKDLYGGGQPTAEGFRQLKAMGVKTIINLRFFHSGQERIAGTDLAYEEVPMNVWHAEDEDAVRFLKLLANKKRAPFYFYCHLGADRTGLLCAVYRIVIQDWTKDEAIAEMTRGGFGFHGIFQNLVYYLRKLDVEKLKQQMSQAPRTD
jgi:protein tyrosine/serine phosphatase